MNGILLQAEGDIEEVVCPFCSMPLRSDANAPAFCGLCGMGVDHLDSAPSIMGADGEELYFCCSWCLRIYTMSRRKEG
ncbi:MAG: hypothetical protein KAJ35_05220 [Thermoplasmata archaeon]|nr:hypothetical protein [Thermoplasmata archaeon]